METAVAESDLTSLQTIRDFIRWVMSALYREEVHLGHGTDDHWDEALLLVLHAVDLPIDVDPNVLDARLTESEKDNILQMLRLRVDDRMPVAYITQEAWFAGLSFYVDERVIIPRSPIAELIEHRFIPWIKDDEAVRILDLCTGSGCIAVTTALVLDDCEVDAVDISEDALEVASINVEDYDVADRVNLIQSDLFENVEGQYNLILCNPPYVAEDELAELPEEYDHEPTLALVSGDDGLDLVKRILATAHEYLTPDGALIMEVGLTAEVLSDTFPDVPFTWIDFANGGDGVFVLTTEELLEYRYMFT